MKRLTEEELRNLRADPVGDFRKHYNEIWDAWEYCIKQAELDVAFYKEAYHRDYNKCNDRSREEYVLDILHSKQSYLAASRMLNRMKSKMEGE